MTWRVTWDFARVARPVVVGWVVLLGVILGVPWAAAGQQGAPPPAGRVGGPPPDPVDLVFDREVFTYPTFVRRNPFQPLSGSDTGPRFENLVLRGRILDELDPSRSIALIDNRAVGSQQASEPAFRVRVGDVIGNTRILEIRDQEVIAEVEEFGVFEVRTLQLVRTAPRATPPPPGSAPGGVGVPGQGGPDGSAAPGVELQGPQGLPPALVGARFGSEDIPRNHEVIVNGGRS